jgi:hypothetical protein
MFEIRSLRPVEGVCDSQSRMTEEGRRFSAADAAHSIDDHRQSPHE